jgi:hypothetical protein
MAKSDWYASADNPLDEETNIKMMLLGIRISHITRKGNKEPPDWFVADLNDPKHYKFRHPNNKFYKTPQEAVEDALVLSIAGADVWE